MIIKQGDGGNPLEIEVWLPEATPCSYYLITWGVPRWSFWGHCHTSFFVQVAGCSSVIQSVWVNLGVYESSSNNFKHLAKTKSSAVPWSKTRWHLPPSKCPGPRCSPPQSATPSVPMGEALVQLRLRIPSAPGQFLRSPQLGVGLDLARGSHLQSWGPKIHQPWGGFQKPRHLVVKARLSRRFSWNQSIDKMHLVAIT